MEKVQLTNRDTKGKKNKTLLAEGLTPAVVYNDKTESTSVMLDSSLAKRLAKQVTSATILDIELDGKQMKAIVKEIDTNPVTEEIRHIAFFEIDETKEMSFSIPFEIVGIAPAVKNNLGVLVIVIPTLEVKCKVQDLIPNIKVDVSKLEHPGQTIDVSELDIPSNITIPEDMKTATVVTITELQKEEVQQTAPAEGATTETEESAGETTEKEGEGQE